VPVPPTRLAILASLDEPTRVQEIVDDNGLPYQTVYTAAQELEDQGIVTSRKEGRQRILSSASPNLPGLTQTLLFDHSREDWNQVFRGDRPVVLHVLHRVGRPSLVADIVDKAERTIHHAIETHAPRGLLVKDGEDYQINPRLGALVEMLEEWAKLRSHNLLQEVAPGGRMVWTLGPEFLFQAGETPGEDPIHAGALSRFAEYGIDLMMPGPTYYYRAHRELDVADAILQALLVEPESKRERSYAALLYELEQPEDLAFKAHIYGLEQQSRAIRRYVETHETDGFFLPWDEHNRFREQYGVGDP
jgi:DNA-binding transcriptional ArsR family regulator